MPTKEGELVGAAEIAHRLGVKPRTVHQWRYRAYLKFPEPSLRLNVGPLWQWGAVRQWAEANGRL